MKTLFRALYFLSLCGSVQLAAVAGWDTTQFEYEPRTGRLMRKVYADGKAISYTYHCGDLPKRITLASGKWRERHYDSRLNGAFYFPCYGSNSEITAYVNESGAVVASYIYGPFGEVNLFTGPMVDEFAFRFMTKRYDIAVGLYDFGARWYSPALHRWLNRDPLGEDGGLNLYVFCGNDPVNKYDPNGCIPLDTIWDLGNIVYDICVGDEVALAADTAALLIPYVPAGATKLVKAARLANVRKVCPNIKSLKVTYEYLPTAQYNFKHTLNPMRGKDWVSGTFRGDAKFIPGWGDEEIKALISEAFSKAKAMGKFKPSDLHGFVYDTGKIVGAADGKITTKIKIHVNLDGKRLHAYPCQR